MMKTAVNWLSWTRDAFARAQQERKPVLLSLVARWCHGCREMDRTTYADTAVVDTIARDFVPVRVDADRRPDLWERYGLGGLPTTAFLTADAEVLGGGTFIPLERMRGVLQRVLSAASQVPTEPVRGPSRSELLTAAPTPDELLDVVFSDFDTATGGFASAPGFPLVAPLELALEIYETTGDPRMRAIVVTALDAMQNSALHDASRGGFFRCSRTSSWEDPYREKLLDVNCSLLRLYVDAAHKLGEPRYQDIARGIVRFLQTALAAQAGGWGNSQWFDGANCAHVDRTQYAGACGAAISATLRAAEALGNPTLAEFAIASLERILVAGYRPAHGVAHCIDADGGSVRGLLEDQISMAGAALDASEAVGSVPYEMMAQELAFHALRTMWDEKDGGLFDRAALADDIGRLRQRVKPLALNCEAVRLLARMASTSGDREFLDKAQLTATAMLPVARDHGPLAAHCLLAMRAAAVK
jgi:uncharacterized protein YyaL (SSP411 family)